MNRRVEFDLVYSAEKKSTSLTMDGEELFSLNRKAMALLFRWLRGQMNYIFAEVYSSGSITLEDLVFSVEFDRNSNSIFLSLGRDKLFGIPKSRMSHFLAWANQRCQPAYFMVQAEEFITRIQRNKEIQKAEGILKQVSEILEKKSQNENQKSDE